MLDQVTTSVASFTADGAYDQEGVAAAVAERHPEALIIVPPRSTAVPSATAESAPTQRDCHLQCITEHGRAARQKASGYTMRARVEATIGRFKQVIGDGLRYCTDQRRAIEVDVAACSKPHVGFGAPDFRPLRLNPAWAGLTAFVLPIPATRPLAAVRPRNCVDSISSE